MITKPTRLNDTPKARSAFFGSLLRDVYDGMVDPGLPDHLAALVRQLDSLEAALGSGAEPVCKPAGAGENGR